MINLWKIIFWAPQMAVEAFLYLIGWVVVPIAAASGAFVEYVGYDGTGQPRQQFRWLWNWMWPWGNDEDGIANDTYYKAPNMFLQVVYWSCWRNPINNLRFIPVISFKYNKAKVRFVGSFINFTGKELMTDDRKLLVFKYDTKTPQWFFAWHGMYSCFYCQFKFMGSLKRVWIGWKIYPSAMFIIPSYQLKGVGFAFELMVNA